MSFQFPDKDGDEIHRDRIADELEGAGWPSVADDVREGVPLDTVLSRLREIGEGDSEAADIINEGGSA